MNRLFSWLNFCPKWVLIMAVMPLCVGFSGSLIHKSQASEPQEIEQITQELQAQRFRVVPSNLVQKASVIGESPTIGSSDRKIVLVVFCDFQCPYCQKAHPILEELIKTHKNQFTLVYKHMPLFFHSEALPAAKASWAAAQQGKFWEFHDLLFENQYSLNETFYVEVAKYLNLDLKRFNQDRRSDAAQKAIDKDILLAAQLGVSGTPSFFINEQPIVGQAQIATLEVLLSQAQGLRISKTQ